MYSANPSVRIGWFAFVYVLLVGSFLQLVLIPLTSWHSGNGLIVGGDWLEFHRKALNIAQEIHHSGWSAWSIRPDGQAPIGVASALYALTGLHRPIVVLPVNALLFAIAAMCMYTIVRFICDCEKYALWSLLPVFLLPSMAIVWGQMHKDIWVMAGVLMILSISMKGLTGGRLSVVCDLLVVLVANLIVWLMRPYAVQLLLFGQIIILLLWLITWNLHRNSKLLISIVLSAFISLGFLLNPLNDAVNLSPVTECPTWSNTLPFKTVDIFLSELACKRRALMHGSTNAASNLDEGLDFHNAMEIVQYTPRALQIGLFAPFPDMWHWAGMSGVSDMYRFIAGVEMIFVYASIVVVVIWILTWGYQTELNSKQRLIVISLIVFSLSWIVIYVLATGNIGTLYRIRLPMVLIWTCLGLVALFSLGKFHKK